MRMFCVELKDYTTGSKFPIDNVVAPENYTSEDYIRDCSKNADADFCEMLRCGEVELVEVEQ